MSFSPRIRKSTRRPFDVSPYLAPLDSRTASCRIGHDRILVGRPIPGHLAAIGPIDRDGPAGSIAETRAPMRLLGHELADLPFALPVEDFEQVVAGPWDGQVLALLHDGDVTHAHLVVGVGAVLDDLRGLVGVARVGGVVEVGEDIDDRADGQR